MHNFEMQKQIAFVNDIFLGVVCSVINC